MVDAVPILKGVAAAFAAVAIYAAWSEVMCSLEFGDEEAKSLKCFKSTIDFLESDYTRSGSQSTIEYIPSPDQRVVFKKYCPSEKCEGKCHCLPADASSCDMEKCKCLHANDLVDTTTLVGQSANVLVLSKCCDPLEKISKILDGRGDFIGNTGPFEQCHDTALKFAKNLTEFASKCKQAYPELAAGILNFNIPVAELLSNTGEDFMIDGSQIVQLTEMTELLASNKPFTLDGKEAALFGAAAGGSFALLAAFLWTRRMVDSSLGERLLEEPA